MEKFEISYIYVTPYQNISYVGSTEVPTVRIHEKKNKVNFNYDIIESKNWFLSYVQENTDLKLKYYH